MAEYPKYVKSWATLDHAKNTTAGPNNAANGVLVSIYDIVNEGINNGDIDVTGDSLGAVVTVDGTQTITGNKTFSGTTAISGAATLSNTATLSGATTISGTLAASNASITMAALPEYADDAAAGAGGLTAGRLYRTAAGAVLVKLA